ncbi:MAG: hypothetical protein U0W40_14445 [Acidimicrobiia bacterium]
MSTVLVVGLGQVGVRTARQLLDTPGVDRVLVGARDLDDAREVATALDDGAEAMRFAPGDSVPEDVDAVASAVPSEADVRVARAALRAGVPFASSADRDDTLRALLALDDEAKGAGTRVLAGCGLAPGLSDVLVRHAVDLFDHVDEIQVARFGVAGPASAAEARRTHGEPPYEWRDGAATVDKRRGPQLVWFPEPVGARECEVVATGVDLLVRANPGVPRITARLGEAPPRRLPLPGRRDPGLAWGSVRVELWGEQGGRRTSVVYGVIERTAVATGTVLGVTAAWLAGAGPVVGDAPPSGAFGLGTVVKPVPFLAELAHRGVKAATFEGVGVG